MCLRASPQSAEPDRGSPSDRIRLEELLKEFPESPGSLRSEHIGVSARSSSSSLVRYLLRHAPVFTYGGCKRLPFLKPEDAGRLAGVLILSANAFTSNAIFFLPVSEIPSTSCECTSAHVPAFSAQHFQISSSSMPVNQGLLLYHRPRAFNMCVSMLVRKYSSL